MKMESYPFIPFPDFWRFSFNCVWTPEKMYFISCLLSSACFNEGSLLKGLGNPSMMYHPWCIIQIILILLHAESFNKLIICALHSSFEKAFSTCYRRSGLLVCNSWGPTEFKNKRNITFATFHSFGKEANLYVELHHS